MHSSSNLTSSTNQQQKRLRAALVGVQYVRRFHPDEQKTNTCNIEQQSLSYVQTPHANDVLCGRGKKLQNYPGNQLFHKMVQQRIEDWTTCSPQDKKKIP